MEKRIFIFGENPLPNNAPVNMIIQRKQEMNQLVELFNSDVDSLEFYALSGKDNYVITVLNNPLMFDAFKEFVQKCYEYCYADVIVTKAQLNEQSVN